MNPHRSTAAHDLPADDVRSSLSAAADGDTALLGAACQAWRDDPSARATWHTYHLIGDVLRSSELAALPVRDEAFLQRLRGRLAEEPVVLAPVAKPVARRTASAWLMPAAVAAGFVVVAGVLVMSQVSAPSAPNGAETLAAAPTATGVTRVSNTARLPAAQLQGDTNLIRDPRLDEFLRAHQAARGGMAVAVPGSALRRVDAQMPAGAER